MSNEYKAFQLREDFNASIDYSKWEMSPVDYTDKYTLHKRHLRVGRAVRLYEIMKLNGATEEELFAIWCLLMVCLDAEKKCLDMDKAFEDFGYLEMKHKYYDEVDKID